MSSNKKITVYIDGVDWDYEVGEAADGNKVYPSIDDLKEYHRCWKGCGIVECEITFKKWVEKHDWHEMSKTSKDYTAKELKENADILRLESARKFLEQLEYKVSKQKQLIEFLKTNVNKKGKK